MCIACKKFVIKKMGGRQKTRGDYRDGGPCDEGGGKDEFEPRTFGSVRAKRKGLIDQPVNYTSPPTTLNFNVSDVSIYFVHRSLSRSRYIFQYVIHLPSSRRPNIVRTSRISPSSF